MNKIIPLPPTKNDNINNNNKNDNVNNNNKNEDNTNNTTSCASCISRNADMHELLKEITALKTDIEKLKLENRQLKDQLHEKNTSNNNNPNNILLTSNTGIQVANSFKV